MESNSGDGFSANTLQLGESDLDSKFEENSSAEDSTSNKPVFQNQMSELFVGSPETGLKRGRFIIHPQSVRKITWDLYVSVLIFYSVIVIPFRIGFDKEATGFWYGFDAFVDVMFFFDMVASFMTAVFIKDVLVVELGAIARHYLRSWFLIDLVSTFPIDLVIGPLLEAGANGADYSAQLRSIKIIKFFRLIRLLKLARLLKLKKFGGSFEGIFSMNPALQRLLKLLLQIIFIAHMCSCFWFFVATINEDSDEETWVKMCGVIDADGATQYIASFYWTVATMMAVGYGDIRAYNSLERCYSILVQLVGSTCFGFIIANIAAFLETFDPRASAYRAKMDTLKEYMRDRGLPRNLQKRVKKYYDYILSKESIFQDVQLLNHLPIHLTESILMHIHGDKVKTINFMRGEDGGFVSFIMSRARMILSIPGELIIEEQSVTNEFYIMMGGQVESYTLEVTKEDPVAFHSVICAIYQQGSTFGEAQALQNIPHRASFRATKSSDMLSISKEFMEFCVYMYPNSALRFRDYIAAHENLIQISLGSASCFYPEIKRRARRVVTVDSISHEYCFNILQEIGTLSVSSELADSFAQALVPESRDSFNIASRSVRVRKVSVLNKTLPVVKERPNMYKVTPMENAKEAKIAQSVIDVLKPKANSKGKFASFKSSRSLHTNLHSKLDETQEEEFDTNVNELFKRYWIIHPTSTWKTTWDLILAAFIVFSVVIVPYRLGFSQAATGFSLYIEYLIDICFGIDIVLSFRTAFENDDDNTLNISSSLIASRYLRGWFLVDFLSTVPFDTLLTLAMGVDGTNPEALRSFKLIKIFRMIRLLKLARLFKLKRILGNIDFEVSPGFSKLSQLLIQITFIAHFFACFFFFASSSLYERPDETWYVQLGLSSDEEVDIQAKYIASLYWAFTTMTTVGYGDISPGTNPERLFAICIMIMGATVFGYVVGSIASLIAMLDLSEALFKTRMSELESYMVEQNVPKTLARECHTSYSYFLNCKSVFDEEGLLATLSPSIRHEILMHVHREAIPQIKFFQNQNITFIADILQIMKPQLATKNSFIVEYGSLGSQMYFLVSGEAMRYSNVWPDDGHFDKSMALRLQAGFCFGYECVLNSCNYDYTIKALSACQLYVVTKKDLGNLVDASPAFAIQFQTQVTKAIKEQNENFERYGKWKTVKNSLVDILKLSPSTLGLTFRQHDEFETILTSALSPKGSKILNFGSRNSVPENKTDEAEDILEMCPVQPLSKRVFF